MLNNSYHVVPAHKDGFAYLNVKFYDGDGMSFEEASARAMAANEFLGGKIVTSNAKPSVSQAA